MVKYFKLYEVNLKIINKREICTYAAMGRIVKHIRNMFPSNWKDVLKHQNIIYSQDYLLFLIRLFNLFNKHTKLYNSSLSLSFFRKNFIIIKTILNNEK